MTHEPEKPSFGNILRFFRGRTIDRRSGKPLSQDSFAMKLSDESKFRITRNAVNNWENEKSYLHSEHDRPLLIAIINVLFKYKGIMTYADATHLLGSGGFKALDDKEAVLINPEWVSQFESPEKEGVHRAPSVLDTRGQTPTVIPPITINIGGLEPIPVVIQAPRSSSRANAFIRFIDFFANLAARMFFAILDRAPDWLIRNRSGDSHAHQNRETGMEITLIDPDCGNQAIDLKQQRLRISAAFGSYFTGLLEKNQSYVNIHGQIDLSLPPNSPKLESFQQIYWLMQYARGPEVVLIAAEGGMGKSTLAAKIIRCLYSDNAVDLLLGDSAKSEVVNPLTGEVMGQKNEFNDLDSFLFKVSSQLGLDYSLGKSNRQQAVRNIKDRLDGRRSILVMDNLETVRDSAELLNTFRTLAGRDTRILVTTRRIAGITHQTPGVFLVRMHPIVDEKIAREFLRWHISANSQSHQQLNKLSQDLDTRENVRLLIDKTGGIPLLMQLVLSDVARSSWSRLEKLPALFGRELLNFLYWEHWTELGQMDRDGENARALLFHILEQSNQGPIDYGGLLQWAKRARGLISVDEPLKILQERFLIVNSDLKQGNFSIFPSLAEFLAVQQSHNSM